MSSPDERLRRSFPADMAERVEELRRTVDGEKDPRVWPGQEPHWRSPDERRERPRGTSLEQALGDDWSLDGAIDERRERCGTCGGTGEIPSGYNPKTGARQPEPYPCHGCNGTGYRPACRPDEEDEDA